MNFKIYDILSLLIPGFIILMILLFQFNYQISNDLVIFYTAISFVIGFIINSISSWLEYFYFVSWGGKPSDKILDGKNIKKVKFFKSFEVREMLKKETYNENPSNDELFLIAKSYVNKEDSKIGAIYAYYTFSRSLLTTILICYLILISEYDLNLIHNLIFMLVLIIVWLRNKQLGYYYVREVLNEYLKQKKTISLSPTHSSEF